MRDFIVIRQKAFYEYLQNYNKNKSEKEKIKLDLKDLAIFDYIAQFCLSDNEKIKNNRIVIDGKEYTHIAYKKIIEDNPFLDIKAKNKSQVIGTRINKLVKLGLLEKIFSQKKGSKTYFRVSFLDDRGITEKLQGVSFENDRGYQSEVIGGITQDLYNRNINIDNKNRETKIENKDSLYIGSLSDFEKNFLRVISNLKDLFNIYNLPAYKEREYLKACKKILDKGYIEEQILISIYARVDKVMNEDVNEEKFLETLSNPNYFVKSIEQLILEANIKVEKLEEEYPNTDEGIIKNEIMPMKFLKSIYLDYYKLSINDYGYFTDVDGGNYSITEECEYHFYLMKKFLAKYNIKLAKDIRFFIINNAIENIPYDILMKRILFALLHYQDKKEYLEMYSSIKELLDLYNEELRFLQIDKDLDEVVKELEQRLIVE